MGTSVSGSRPSIFDSRQSSFVEGNGPRGPPAHPVHAFVIHNEGNVRRQWRQHPPPRHGAHTPCEPRHPKEHNRSRQAEVRHKAIQPLTALNHLAPGLESCFVFFHGVHMSCSSRTRPKARGYIWVRRRSWAFPKITYNPNGANRTKILLQ